VGADVPIGPPDARDGRPGTAATVAAAKPSHE
jgi:hypothetical protein